MRIGCDGSRETLFIRNLIRDDQLNCHWCGIIESRKHIIEECKLYNHPRNRLKSYLVNDGKFKEIAENLTLI